MILGGTPYYLDLLRKEYSLAQNIDFFFFKTNAELSEEYGILLKSLFRKAGLTILQDAPGPDMHLNSSVSTISRKSRIVSA